MEIGEIIWLVSRPLYRPLWAAVIGGVIDCGGTVGSAKGCRVVSSYSIEPQILKKSIESILLFELHERFNVPSGQIQT